MNEEEPEETKVKIKAELQEIIKQGLLQSGYDTDNPDTFAINNKSLRDGVEQIVSKALVPYNYTFVCDETNNTKETISKNELNIDVSIEYRYIHHDIVFRNS